METNGTLQGVVARKKVTLVLLFSSDTQCLLLGSPKVIDSLMLSTGFTISEHSETLIFDVLKVEWSVVVSAAPSSVTSNKVRLH